MDDMWCLSLTNVLSLQWYQHLCLVPVEQVRAFCHNHHWCRYMDTRLPVELSLPGHQASAACMVASAVAAASFNRHWCLQTLRQVRTVEVYLSMTKA